MTKTIRLLFLTALAVTLGGIALADSGSFYNPIGQCTINWDCGDQCSTGTFVCIDVNDCSTCGAVCQDCSAE
jgi:hypothetical protein